MEKEKNDFLTKINPRNFNFTSKVILLALGIGVMILLLILSLGLNTLFRALIKSSSCQMQEMAYTKAAELEAQSVLLKNNVLTFAGREDVVNAAVELSNAFLLLTEENADLVEGARLTNLKMQIEEYYHELALTRYPLSSEDMLNFQSSDPLTSAGQYLFIMQNPKSPGEKDEYNNYSDGSSYARVHITYHGILNSICKNLLANDLLLADPKTGYIFYSAAKNIDFGTNLFEGPLKNTKIAEAAKASMASGDNKVYVTDIYNYTPAGDMPVIFFSVPIYNYDQVIAILIVQFGTDIIDSKLSDPFMAAKEYNSEYNLIGADLKLRNNPASFIHYPERFTGRLMKLLGRKASKMIDGHKQMGNMALITRYPVESKQSLLSEEKIHFTDYLGNKAIGCSRKVRISDNTDFFLVSEIDRREVLKPFREKLLLCILLSAILIYVSFLLVRSFGRSFSARIKSLLEGMILLYNGEKAKELSDKSFDELGGSIEAFNSLRGRINNAEEFALEMSDGNYNYNFNILSERDSLGKSLNILKDTLIKSREEHEKRAGEDDIRNWINDGVAKFNDLLRENNSNIKLLGYSLIENLVAYLNAGIGGIFMVEGDQQKHIELLASYAYDRRKYQEKVIEIGEGLLGACYLEKKPAYLTHLPQDYIEITSGLGHEVPKCLYIVPLKVDEEVIGMIEIASFNEFSNHQIEFINRVADSIAGTFVSVRLNMRTVLLLEESKRKAEEITQQEEEMRQNLEEMQATQEELARLRQDDEKRTRDMQLVIDNTRLLLKNFLDAIPGGYILKDPNGVIELANAEGALFYGATPDRILGKTDHELLGSKVAQAEHKKDTEALKMGEISYEEHKEIQGKTIKYKVTKKPFEISDLKETGVLTIRMTK